MANLRIPPELSLLKKLKETFSKLKSDRTLWESHWNELLLYILPRKGTVTGTNVPGSKRQAHLLDNTAMQSNEILAGALHGMLTNPFSQWFELSSGDEKLDLVDAVRLWLQDSAKRMHVIINQSNFQTEVHELYLDLGCIGTAPMLIEEDDVAVVRFSAKTIKSVYVKENSLGVIDEIYRPFAWDAALIAEKFGEEKLNKRMLKALEIGSQELFELCHVVYPLNRYDSKAKSRFKFQSCYYFFEEDLELESEGFYENPWLTPRWTKLSDETYGRSPGMVALPEAKTVNKMTETIIKAGQKKVDPPIMVPDDGFIMPIKLTPGGINIYRAGGQDRLEPLFKHNIDVDFGYQAMEQHRDRIRKAFYVDQLQMAPVSGQPLTATEVNQRVEERLRLLGPLLGRQQVEFLEPLITRLFGIMQRRNLLLTMPNEMKTIKGLVVRYSSLIARAQRASEGDTINRTLQGVAPFIQMDPTVMDNFDGDATARKIAVIFGAPQEMIRSADSRDKLRQARSDAQKQAIQQNQEQHQADVIQKVTPAMQMGQKPGK